MEECLPYLEKSVRWLQEQDEDNDCFPSGYGIIEIAGLNMEMIDTAVYTCEAYDCFSRMLRKLNRQGEAEKYRALFLRCRDAINEKLWDEKAGLYCDAYASYDTIRQKLAVIEQLAERCESREIRDSIHTLLEERKGDGIRERGWLLNRNWVINTPMETGIAPNGKAAQALERMRKPDFIGRYGMYLDALTQKAVMTINTGVMAVAQARYGYADEALALIHKIFDTFSMATPGSISEMSPDYGCFVQAWTAYGPVVTVVRHFFGIDPRDSEGRIVLKPQMPAAWPIAVLKNLRILDGIMDVTCERTGDRIRLSVRNTTSYPVVLDSFADTTELILIGP